jgi:class 3 adenylate cyclase/tRNA A-37 threonylcarbamoyl transferase component Bud32
MTAPPQVILLLKVLRRLLNLLLLVPLVGFLALFGLQFHHPAKWDAFGPVVQLHNWGDPVLSQLDAWLEWPPAVRWYPLALAILFWIGRATAEAKLQGLLKTLTKPKVRPAPLGVSPLRTPPPILQPKSTPSVLDTLPPDSEQAREELLKRYREIEEALKSSRRKQCTFLAVDLVDSTHMKEGHGSTEITVSFRAYEDMVKKVFKQYGAWKQAWTPDGVMVCFLQRELAVGAAQRILQNLDNLNATSNRLRTPFRARSGVHEGEVPIYEDTNLERVADRVIDVAGHLQKHANPNTLWVSADVYAHLQDKSGFFDLQKTVDGYKVYGWAPEPPMVSDETYVGEVVPPTIINADVPIVQAGAHKRISRYEILKELGRGAMGAVYMARDPQIERTVAIKVIQTGNLADDEFREYKQRFYREARAAGQMAHPGIVTIHDIGEDEAGHPFLVMEYVEGVPLEKLVAISTDESESKDDTKQPAVPLVIQTNDALDVALQVAEALHYAHQRGVIHRDIKPANILITPESRAKILDFGVAQLAGTKVTQAGRLVGTPAFMSPEQFAGGTVDARSDIFSLGTVLYWMCTGQNPFAADTLTAVAYKVAQGQPPPPRKLNPTLPREIDIVLARCLAKDPDKRYPTGRALASDLEGVRLGRPISSSPGSAQQTGA